MTARDAAGRAGRLARRILRTARALWRFAKGHTPKWLLPVLGVCLFIPGPFDELAVLALVLWPVLRSRAGRAELAGMIRDAWKIDPSP